MTGSSACIRFRMSATRTDAFPFALTFGITPKEDYKIKSYEIIIQKYIYTDQDHVRFHVNYGDIFHIGITPWDYLPFV